MELFELIILSGFTFAAFLGMIELAKILSQKIVKKF